MTLFRIFRNSTPIMATGFSKPEPILSTEQAQAPVQLVSFIDEFDASAWVGLHYRHEFLLHYKHELLEHQHSVGCRRW
jgi:hypothetical protein